MGGYNGSYCEELLGALSELTYEDALDELEYGCDRMKKLMCIATLRCGIEELREYQSEVD